MDKSKVKYIVTYYSQYFSENEKKAWRHWSEKNMLETAAFMSTEQKKKRIEASLKMGWMTKDSEVLALLKGGIDAFEVTTATRINKEQNLQFNNCPKCHKLARTPKAKQCRFCKYNWH